MYNERGFMKKKIKLLFKNLCCSACKADFDENSIEILRQEDGLSVVHLTCQNCGKSFGVAFLGLSNIELKDEDANILEVQDGPEPINYDDVIDAHRFIKKLDAHWSDYLHKSE